MPSVLAQMLRRLTTSQGRPIGSLANHLGVGSELMFTMCHRYWVPLVALLVSSRDTQVSTCLQITECYLRMILISDVTSLFIIMVITCFSLAVRSCHGCSFLDRFRASCRMAPFGASSAASSQSLGKAKGVMRTEGHKIAAAHSRTCEVFLNCGRWTIWLFPEVWGCLAPARR